MAEHSSPARYSSSWFEQFAGDVDPATRAQVAHDFAAALLHRVRDAGPGADELLERIRTYTSAEGLETITALWADAPARSLPGALLRVHYVSAMVEQQLEETSLLYQAGLARGGAAGAIAGAEEPGGPQEIAELSRQILRGVFTGDFALALDRQAAFCILVALGALQAADTADGVDDERATRLTAKAQRLSRIAEDLRVSARLWERGHLY